MLFKFPNSCGYQSYGEHPPFFDTMATWNNPVLRPKFMSITWCQDSIMMALLVLVGLIRVVCLPPDPRPGGGLLARS